MWLWWLLVLLLTSSFLCDAWESSCNARKYDQDSIVCVCNSKICDYVADPGPIAPDGFHHYLTSRDGSRLSMRSGRFTTKPADELRFPERTVVIKADPSRAYQEVLGFGGAMSDASGSNIASLSWNAQKQLVRQYYGDGGIDYTFLRIPIGGSDFSSYNYTYLDEEDETLESFRLTKDDYTLKIPYVKMAQKMSRSPIKLFASAWSSPEWMKELRNGTIGFTRLKRKYYQLWADYFIRFFDEYKKQGLEFWGLTAQNEPFHGTIVYFAFNSLGWTPEEQRDWIAGYLGPTLHREGYGDLKLIMLDDQRTFLPEWPNLVLEDEAARKYISGIGVHWYWDYLNITAANPETTLSQTHHLFPDKFLLYTESCNIPFTERGSSGVMLGNWERAENYSTNIIEDMNHWVTGWVDWNMALDLQGGPNWAVNYVDAPIIVNASADEFYKQPMFYALAHFSKFVPPGSRRIHTQLSTLSLVETVAFVKPDKSVAVVILNRKHKEVDVFLRINDEAYAVVRCPGHSIHTVLYNTTGLEYRLPTDTRKPQSRPGPQGSGVGNIKPVTGQNRPGFGPSRPNRPGLGSSRPGFRRQNGPGFGSSMPGLGPNGASPGRPSADQNGQGFAFTRQNGPSADQSGQGFPFTRQNGPSADQSGQGFPFTRQNGPGFGSSMPGLGSNGASPSRPVAGQNGQVISSSRPRAVQEEQGIGYRPQYRPPGSGSVKRPWQI